MKASCHGYTLRDRDSSLSFLVGRFINIIWLYVLLKVIDALLAFNIFLAIVEKVQLVC